MESSHTVFLKKLPCVYDIQIYAYFCICIFYFVGSKEAELECPKQHSPGHMVFEKTGVEVVSLDNNRSALQHLPRDLVLHATPERLDLPGLLEDDEFPLSPAFIFILKNQLRESVELQIPHGANMVLSSKKWKIIFAQTHAK